MKRIVALILILTYALFTFVFTGYAASVVSPVSDGSGWILDFSSAEDGAEVPFTLTNATATVSDGYLAVKSTETGTRMIYNGGDFSVNADEIRQIVIVARTQVGAYFQPYLYFGGSFSGTNVFKGKAIPGTGDWQEIVIDTAAKTIKIGTLNCTGEIPENLNWSGVINAFRLDNARQNYDYDIKSVSFRKAPARGISDGKGWSLDFSSCEDGTVAPFTLTNSSVGISDGALNVTTTAKGPRLIYNGDDFSVNADEIEKIVIKLKSASGAKVQPYLYFGGSFSGTNVFKSTAIPGTGDWQEVVIDTGLKTVTVGSTDYTGAMPEGLNWSGIVNAFRLDSNAQTSDFSVRSIEFLKAPVSGFADGVGWTIDFSEAVDGALPLINAHGDDRINTNAAYSISGGALQVAPIDSTVTAPRIAVSNRSNFSVNSEDITKIRFKIRSEATLKKAILFYASQNGDFSKYLTAVIGAKDSDGWQELVFYPQAYSDWLAIDDPITKFRFDLTLSASASYEVEYIRFTDEQTNSYSVTFDGYTEPVVLSEGSLVTAPADEPVKAEHTFYGWAIKGTSKDVTFPYILTDNVVFTPLWAPDSLIEAGNPHPERYFADKAPVKDYAYSFCVVGDTQILAARYPDKFTYIYDWIVANKKEKNIEFVFGLGDITNDSTVAEWELAYEHINKLNGVVPYSLIRGSENHDRSAMFNEYFNKPVYTDTLEGFYDESSINNTWRTFSVGGVDYLFLMLDFGPSDDVLRWAGEVIEQHPYHRVIISTHCYLYSDGTTVDYTDEAPPHKTEVGDGTKNNGDEMWDKLISRYENIFLVLCGHIDTSKIVVSKDVGIHGNTVTSMLIDPQGVDGGITPSGLVAMLYFSEDGKSIEVEYYSTVLDMYYMAENQMTIEIPEYSGNPDKKSCIDGYDNHTASIYSKDAGTYTVIFADYEDGELVNIDYIPVSFAAGEYKKVSQVNTGFTLEKGDMVMLWQDMINVAPVCDAHIVK